MIGIINSPLKILGLLTIILGLLAVSTFSYFFFFGVYFLGIGFFVFFIDYLAFRFLKHKKTFWIAQTIMSSAYLIIAFVAYMRWQEHNYIIFPKDFKGQAGIIFGIEGYPELPRTVFWKKTINIPPDGLIITSTKEEDIPTTIRFAYTDKKASDDSRVNWEPNYDIDCIVSDSRIKCWLFQVENEQSSYVKDAMTKLCNEISANRKKSLYKTENSVIWTDNKGKYLWLQNKGLTSLPNGLEKVNIYKAILTGNNLTKVPRQILEISSLEDLILAANPISEFPCDLYKLKSLKSISFAETGIKEINCNLSQLDSLEDFDISRNGLEQLPEQIKNIPKLNSLILNNNKFVDFSFVDNRLNKLETLYLYSNEIKRISKETRYLANLKELLIFDNMLDSIPDNISDFMNLEKLEIWNNPIKYISPEIGNLTKLKMMRVDDDFLTQSDQENLRRWLPNCEIKFQTRSKK